MSDSETSRSQLVRRRFALLRVLAASALLASAPSAHAQGASEPLPVAGIDLYGTNAISPDAFREEFGSEIVRFIAQAEDVRLGRNADQAGLEARAEQLRGAIQAKLASLVPLARVDFGAMTDFGPPPRIYVTIEVVEEADKVRRMPFREPPTGRFEDPGGLFALWDEFQQKVFTLAYAGTSLKVNDCPVLHCIAPFDLPELEPYLERFNAGAREHEELLYTIAAQSGDASQRANALFLLAHTNDAERLLPVLGHAIYDPSGTVRNNAMRVMLFMAKARPELDYPVEDLIAALDFPSGADRNKAGYTLAALAAQSRYRAAIRDGAVPIALRMLRLLRPNNHDAAYEILKLVSGESYGDGDYAAWERWAAANNLSGR
jgi:hypothetical protein